MKGPFERNGRRTRQLEPFDKVRAFTRFLSLIVTFGIGVALCLAVPPYPTLPVLLAFSAAGGIAWLLAGWFADAAFQPIPSSVERGIVVGLVVSVVASIGFGIDLAAFVGEDPRGPPSLMDVVRMYVFCIGIVAALSAVPGTVLGAIVGLAVQARTGMALRRRSAGEKIRTV